MNSIAQGFRNIKAVIRIIVSVILLALAIISGAKLTPQPQSRTIEPPTETRTILVQSASGFYVLEL